MGILSTLNNLGVARFGKEVLHKFLKSNQTYKIKIMYYKKGWCLIVRHPNKRCLTETPGVRHRGWKVW